MVVHLCKFVASLSHLSPVVAIVAGLSHLSPFVSFCRRFVTHCRQLSLNVSRKINVTKII